MKIMLELRFVFARHCEVLLWHNYVMYMFDVVTYFDGVRITLYFDTFELRTEIPLQLRFVFVRHRDICKYRHNYVSFLFVIVTITQFFCSMYLRFLMTLELHYILGRSNYVRKLRYKVVCNQKITKNYVIT